MQYENRIVNAGKMYFTSGRGWKYEIFGAILEKGFNLNCKNDLIWIAEKGFDLEKIWKS